MYLPKLAKLKRHWKLFGLLALDSLLFGFTNAGSAPAYALIVGFVLLVATLRYLLYGILAFARLYGLSVKRKRYLAGYFTILTGFLLALQSIGELNSRDVLVLLPLVVIGYTYSLYGKTATRLPGI
jgi:hypothetical protein